MPEGREQAEKVAPLLQQEVMVSIGSQDENAPEGQASAEHDAASPPPLGSTPPVPPVPCEVAVCVVVVVAPPAPVVPEDWTTRRPPASQAGRKRARAKGRRVR